jgi:peptidoglycan/xylan/chitin deacetylase (PgdA/CDA1 family)
MWPEGYSSAVSFTFDFDAEEVWIADDPANADRPGALSQGRYGAKVGVPRVLDLLEQHGIRATFFIPARNAERYPDRVRQIAEAGHEIAHHGYTHSSPTGMTRDQEEEELTKGLSILREFSDEVVGYRSPAWDFSANTLDLLQRHGFRYSSNFMDDLVPYRHEGTSIVELPVQWTLDDAAHFWFDGSSWLKKISTASEVKEIWNSEFLGIRKLGGCCVFTMHPQVIGRPYRLAFLDELMGFVKGHEDVWIATCGEIAARVP